MCTASFPALATPAPPRPTAEACMRATAVHARIHCWRLWLAPEADQRGWALISRNIGQLRLAGLAGGRRAQLAQKLSGWVRAQSGLQLSDRVQPVRSELHLDPSQH
eukprot:COSAG01_NODE_369_length_18046_cov_130.301443_4_plen_106_part_00